MIYDKQKKTIKNIKKNKDLLEVKIKKLLLS